MLRCARFLVVGTHVLCILGFLDWLGTVVGARAPPWEIASGVTCVRLHRMTL